jgi:aspartate kinase
VVIFTGITVSSRPSIQSQPRNRSHFRLSDAANTISSFRPLTPQQHVLVAKFGGTSLANARRISRAVRAVADEYARGTQIVVVVSAVGRTTDRLLELTNRTRNFVGNDRDDVLAMGERTSARIFAASLKTLGIQVRYFDPSDKDWPIITDDNFSQANPLRKKCAARIRRYVAPLLAEGIVSVVAGFIGRTQDGRVSTLGRGGSDTTALILAEALKADEVVLVTDSPGVMTGNPKLIHQPRLIKRIQMQTLSRMADSGSKFIHRKALRFKDPNIDIRVISHKLGNLRGPGTIISGEPVPELEVRIHNPHPVASVTLVGRSLSKDPTLMTQVTKIARRNLEAVSEDDNSIILYLRENRTLKKKIGLLHKAVLDRPGGVAVAVRTGTTLIAVKGVGLEETPGITARITEALRINNINIFGILTISSSVLVLVGWKERQRAARLIRQSLESN